MENTIVDFYNNYNEDKRLTSKSHLPEYLTTMRYIEKYLKPDSKILEIGAGTGRYSLALADKGYKVDAVELVPHNIRIMKKKVKAIREAIRVAKHGGIIYAAYCNNDTCIYKMFYRRKILDLLKKGMIDENYHVRSSPNEIFELYRKPDIDNLMKDYNITRLHFVGVDMLSYLYSNDLDKLNKKEFNEYMKFLSTICEREDLTGFSIHMLDIFRKE